MALEQLDSFMQSIRRIESGSFRGNYAARNASSGAYGAYQIMPGNWAGWAAQAGLPGANPRDPAAQDAVARYKFMDYYRRYGDWNLVAMAWFAGEGTVQKYLKGGAVGNRADVTGTTVDRYISLMRTYMLEVEPENDPAPSNAAQVGLQESLAQRRDQATAPRPPQPTNKAWYFPVYLDPENQLARWFGSLAQPDMAETPNVRASDTLRNMMVRMSEAVKKGSSGAMGAPPSDQVDLSGVDLDTESEVNLGEGFKP